MKKLTHKELVEMAVKIIYSHSNNKKRPITIISKEKCGDHLIHVHRSALSEVYKVTSALTVMALLREPSHFSEDYFRVDII